MFKSIRQRFALCAFRLALCTLLLAASPRIDGQNLPATPDQPWSSERAVQFLRQAKPGAPAPSPLVAGRVYTLAELVDLAESRNPETRSAWQLAKARAHALGIEQASLFPTLTAVALAGTQREGALIGSGFHRQTIGLYQPTLHLDYLLFDFGGRSGAIAEAKADLFGADFAFNDVHRNIIYRVTESYYRLLNAIGQEQAAQAALLNAQTVEKDAQARMDHGLGTLPDLLEAQSATAQADYELQSALGAREIAQGDLATTVALAPEENFQVEDIASLPVPDALADSVDQATDRALAQRPDLLAQVAKTRAASAALRQARSSYIPTLSLSGDGGLVRAYGQQDLLAGSYAESETWNVQLKLRWTLFDGLRREHALAAARARQAAATAEVSFLQQEISNQVWQAWSNTQTALRQRRAADALLFSAGKSYDAAVKSYNLGVRNLLDVVSAQRALAQARSADVSARTRVLTEIANLAFRTGDSLHRTSENSNPRP